jgi:protease-4
MSLDADLIVDRRRMRRKLTFWRVFAALVLIGAVVAVAASLRRGQCVDRGRRLYRAGSRSPALSATTRSGESLERLAKSRSAKA